MVEEAKEVSKERLWLDPREYALEGERSVLLVLGSGTTTDPALLAARASTAEARMTM